MTPEALRFNVSFILSTLALFGTIITSVSFFLRLRWESDKHTEDIKRQAVDINNLGKKLDVMRDSYALELKQVLAKIDIIDKSLIEVLSTMRHIQETVGDLRKRVFKEV